MVTAIKQNLKVTIIENDKFFADSLQLILSRQEGMDVVNTYYSAEDAIVEIQYVKPDIILLDIDLGKYKKNGLEAIKDLLALSSKSQIMILTIFDEYEKVFEALQNGALGYILKSDTSEKIVEAIMDLASGGAPMSPTIARKVTHSFYTKKNVSQPLSEREAEIITFISKGFSEKEVASKLFLSPFTIKKHISNIYKTLQVNTRTAALNSFFGNL